MIVIIMYIIVMFYVERYVLRLRYDIVFMDFHHKCSLLILCEISIHEFPDRKEFGETFVRTTILTAVYSAKLTRINRLCTFVR
jgi:predicted deacylase